jgi:hypothetical protein
MRSIKQVSEEVSRQNPSWLYDNVVHTVFLFLMEVRNELTREGYKVRFIGKTRGESQHTPHGFQEHLVGSHWITGLSHDALWVNDAQYDFVISANDTHEPIYLSDSPQTEQFRIKAGPTANPVDPKWWRANNPQVEWGPKVEPKPSQPPVVTGPKLKDRDTFYKELQEINNFYKAFDGLQRYGGMVIGDQADVEALGSWGYSLMLGMTVEQCKAEIRKSFEWRAKH